MKTIKVRQTRLAGHSWRSKDELISNILLWTPSHGRAKIGWPARALIQKLCADTGCSQEDLAGVMDDRDRRWERVGEISDSSTKGWWWRHLAYYYSTSSALTTTPQLTFDPAVNQRTGASGQRYQGLTLTVEGLNWVQMQHSQEAGGCQTMI